ncbi:putative glycerophosphoryl diester phosphodiesterase [Zafaria cholistanensis]|uniref:Putative glycerophosphoryl diester phosphodiesterase n=1 Tax=Zafaria cholistanensis TaxID=1682741 RepID=A0A5A7NTL4_9MICC|nr:glycerophosphodiester phosphodiesterase family protein [Zafaria cholistanensis]GER24099.1 putative glycerophosphoryl diester phosphodiesterase [Zafaria cholistanensis]
MRQLIYAHRGSSAVFAENTRAAFLQALADGADGVECDVHLTADHQVVCHHDPTVDRTSNGTGPVSAHTLGQLRALDFSTWKGAALPEGYGAPDEQVLTLAELVGLLEGAGREIGLAVELKHPSPFGRLLEEKVLAGLEALGWDRATSRIGNVAVSFMSFDPGSVAHLLRTVPPRFVCQLVGDADPEWAGEVLRVDPSAREEVAGAFAREAGGAVAHLDAGLVGMAGPGVGFVRRHPGLVRRWLEAGLVFRVWTVDADADVDYLRGLGIQQLTSNRPAHVRARLGRGAR